MLEIGPADESACDMNKATPNGAHTCASREERSDKKTRA
jgi:hypothetical protein